MPNFRWYHWAFTLRPFVMWFDPKMEVSCWALEERMVHPWSLTDALFANIPSRQCQLSFGPVSYLMQVWCSVERHCNSSCRWHLHSPIFNNNGLLIGGRPINFPQWERGGIHLLVDVFSLNGLCSFLDLKNDFNLPGTSFFFLPPA